MTHDSALTMHREPHLEASSMLVGWSEDAGALGSMVADYVTSQLGCREFAEIEPIGFFPLGGVSIEDDVAQFPESRFHVCEEKSIVVLKSNPPRSGWQSFVDTVLHVAEQYCGTKELYTIGSMVYFGTHTTPRQLLVVANSPETRGALSSYTPWQGMNYETPPGQRPTISAYLQWAARSRGIVGASVWVPVPFYLAGSEDPRAWKKIVEFLNSRLGFGVDLRGLDDEIARQEERIDELAAEMPEIGDSLRRLEARMGLAPEENEKLVREMDDYLKRRE